MSDNETNQPSQLSDEEVNKLYEYFEAGATYNDILEADDVDVGSKSTIAKYKDLWKQDREIEEQIYTQELTPDKFREEIQDIPKMGKKKRNFAYRLVKINPNILQDPNEVYKLLTQQVGLNSGIAETVVNGLLQKYFDDEQTQGNRYSPFEGGGYGGSGTKQPPHFSQPAQQKTPQSNFNNPQNTQPNPQGQVPQQQQPVQQNQPQQTQGQGQTNSDVIVRYPPVRDEEGNVVSDDNGNVITERVEIPVEQANKLQGSGNGQSDQTGSELDRIKKLVEIQKEMKADRDEGKSDDSDIAKLVGEIQKSNRRLQKTIISELSDEKQKGKGEDSGQLTKEDLERKVEEIEHHYEERLKDERIDKLEEEKEEIKHRHEEALNELKKGKRQGMDPGQYEKEHEKEMTELTADKSVQMLDTITEKGQQASNDLLSTFKELVNQIRTEGEFTREEEQYKRLVNNLMQMENFSRQEAQKKAEILLFGSSPQTQQPQNTEPQSNNQGKGNLKAELGQRARDPNR